MNAYIIGAQFSYEMKFNLRSHWFHVSKSQLTKSRKCTLAGNWTWNLYQLQQNQLQKNKCR